MILPRRTHRWKDWGSYGTQVGEFRTPHAMLLDREGIVYVADRGNTRIQVFDSEGDFQRMILLNVPYAADYQPPFTAVNPDRTLRALTAPWSM